MKRWLVIAVVLIVLGAAMFGAVMTEYDWDLSGLSTVAYETNTYEIKDAFTQLYVQTDTADVIFLPADGGSATVVCRERENVKHTVAVKDGVLTVCVEDDRKWYERIEIGFGSPSITVYVPQGEYKAACVKTSTGDVELPKELSFESIDIAGSTGDITCHANASEAVKLTTSTGDIFAEELSPRSMDVYTATGDGELKNIACGSFVSDGQTGDISLENVVAENRLCITRSTGDVRLEACDGAEILIETDTGNVTGSLLTQKVFVAHSDTGRVDVPKSITGGKCEITTDTGNIRIRTVD